MVIGKSDAGGRSSLVRSEFLKTYIPIISKSEICPVHSISIASYGTFEKAIISVVICARLKYTAKV